MEENKKNKRKGIIKFIIFLLIIIFIIGCWKFEPLANSDLVKKAKVILNNTVQFISDKTGGTFARLVENYEPDEYDDRVYEVTDTQNRYYYNQLDENSKIIYAEILHNLERIKQGEDNIRISSKLSSLSTSENMSDALMQAFQNAWDAFRNDNVDVFYIDGTKMCLVTKTIKKGLKTSYEFYISKGQNNNYLIDGFDSVSQVNDAIVYVENVEKNILNTITEKNDYYKIMRVHNWIVDNLQYSMDGKYTANIYGALTDKKVVCEGYARLFKSFMDKLEIPCIIVSGEGLDLDTNKSESHAWNYVYLKGEWYAVDVTWDDPVIIGNGKINADLKYKYFLLGSKNFEQSHIEDGKLVDNGMKFVYPLISYEDYVRDK